MRNTTLTLCLVVLGTVVSACDSDAERGLVGAAGGAVLSKATGGDPLTGAIIGGTAGVFCDDAGVCE